MKISKRQLKRIIREEYTLLKRKGLIRESRGESAINFHRREMGGMEDRSLDRIDDMIMYLDDMMMQADQALGSYEMDDERTMDGYQDSFDDMEDPSYIRSKLQAAFPDASMEEIEEAMASF